MDVLSVLFVGATLLSLSEGQTFYQYRQQYYYTLLSLYKTNNQSTADIIARVSNTDVLSVSIQAQLLALQGMDEVEGSLEVILALNMNWEDQVVQASGYNHSDLFNTTLSGVDSLLMPYGIIWTPNLVLFNSFEQEENVNGNLYRPRYFFDNGKVSWSPRVKVHSACTPDVTFYPFDRQTCGFDFVAWGNSARELVFQVTQDDWDMSFYEGNGEWDILRTTVSTFEKSSTSFLRLSITIGRKPLYFAFNIILPILVLVVLNGMVFWLPIESGERIGFSVTCFLSFVVLLNMIMDILPRSSSPMSYLCFYAVSMMIFSGGTTGTVIVQMRIFHKPEKDKVPSCLQKLVRVLSCHCRNQKVADEEKEVKKEILSSKPLKTPAVTKRPNPNSKQILESEDQEEEVTWQDLARSLDKFLFLAFVGGQALFTLLFIAPVAANA